MEDDAQLTGGGMNIVPETDEADTHEAEKKVGVLEAGIRCITQNGYREDYAPAPQGHFRMRASFVGMVNDIVPVGYIKIQQLQEQKDKAKKYIDDGVKHS